jgi:hypothetical protein
MGLLSPAKWPFWLQVARIAVTVLVTAACGVHAWASLRSSKHLLPSGRWILLLYAGAFLFAAWANFVLLLVTAYSGSYKQGPYRFGMFSLLLVVTYFFAARSATRRA